MSNHIRRTHLLSTISEISQTLRNKTLTVAELVQMCLQRIENTKYLNAFITVNNTVLENAKLSQQRIDKGENLHILDGIPIAIKDNFCTKGIKTTCASKMLSDFVPPYNASVVKSLINCGALMVGKTNMDEFALGSGSIDSFYGPVKNPWKSGLKYRLLKRSKHLHSKENEIEDCTGPSKDDCTEPSKEDRTQSSKEDFFISGGSSGGSAVAVATGCCYGAIGSDSGGSTRSPAAKCGIVGLKPTYGRVSRHGLIPLCNSADVPGVLTRTVDDAAILLNSIESIDVKDSTMSKSYWPCTPLPMEPHVEGLKIGIPKEYFCSELSPEVSKLWIKIADMFEKNGAKVTAVSLPHTKYSIVCYSILNCCDVASNFARYDGIKFGHRAKIQKSTEELFAITRHQGFGEVVRGRILAGNYFLLKKNYEKYFVKATQIRRLIFEDFQNVFQSGINLLLTPVTLSDAVTYSKWMEKSNREHLTEEDFCTQPVNLAGLPAISVPCALSENGLPLSLQLIGHFFQEHTLLTAAKWMEQNLNFPILDYYVDELSL